MLCSICKENEATVHLTQIVGEKMHKVDLCEACSKQKGINNPTGFGLADVILGLKNPSEEIEEPETDSPAPVCSSCGYTLADLKKTGRLGCPACFDVFEPTLADMLRPMHKGIQHKGKVPASLQAKLQADQRLQTLESSLASAIEEERYEDAARLRDEIKAIKGRSSGKVDAGS